MVNGKRKFLYVNVCWLCFSCFFGIKCHSLSLLYSVPEEREVGNLFNRTKNGRNKPRQHGGHLEPFRSCNPFVDDSVTFSFGKAVDLLFYQSSFIVVAKLNSRFKKKYVTQRFKVILSPLRG